MYVNSVSGQSVFFGLFSTASGLPITSAGANIVAKKTIDAGSQATCSGVISEPGSGQYRFQGWDSDFGGSVVGLMFTASGAAPVHYNIVTTLAVSGNLFLNSGQGVLVYSGQLSGQPVSLLSGRSFPASGVSVTASVWSGTVFLASGSLFLNTFASGLIGGGSGNLPSAWGGSGAVVVGLNLDKSGYTAGILSGVLSGQPVFPLSGANVVAALLSGQSVLAYSGQLSGQPQTLLSGFSYPASGIFVTATATLASGQVWLSSGQAVSLNSGQSVLMSSGQMSGQQVNLTSGQSFTASGLRVVAASVLDKSGYILTSGGLDQVQVESGMNFRQSQSIVAAAAAGRFSGAGGVAASMDGANVSGTNRISAVIDSSGNRTSVTLSLP